MIKIQNQYSTSVSKRTYFNCLQAAKEWLINLGCTLIRNKFLIRFLIYVVLIALIWTISYQKLNREKNAFHTKYCVFLQQFSLTLTTSNPIANFLFIAYILSTSFRNIRRGKKKKKEKHIPWSIVTSLLHIPILIKIVQCILLPKIENMTYSQKCGINAAED